MRNKQASTTTAGLRGSAEAKRTAAVLLEVLSGVRHPRDGSAAMGVSLSRYYTLETRALEGMIAGLERRGRGRPHRPEDDMERLRRQRDRLERDLGRAQALVRSAQRSFGLPPSPEPDTRGTLRGKRTAKGQPTRRRPRRALRAIRRLRRKTPEPGAPSGREAKEEAACPQGVRAKA
ncbi:MAG: hypothetical protein ACE5JG_05570 [Planctomycetota bacterium]